ncbi:VOC family protein [Levilactobacillus suantsaii]|uniref:VOC family protein n=1 Tax=Levilactobacillus suantsaii TaxID=2292255 RepID=A0A4Q0VJY3_9LACO|nr:VOC family protein [Levilactobacillus suantsaii]QMU08118.1 VOC family protein [Levilactobacillus suantsaii]RXI79030.1 VOC family protein [Levilactobacillus suantsaii]
MNIRDIDHITLTVSDLERSIRWYHEVLDLPVIEFDDGRRGVKVGKQKINFQVTDHPKLPVAKHPTVGAADFAIIATDSLANILSHLTNYAVEIVDGPLPKSGALGPMTSIYVRDPDENLIEIGKYDN